MPIKFVFGEEESEEALKNFDKQMDIKMRTFLLERLKKEFEDSLKLLHWVFIFTFKYIIT